MPVIFLTYNSNISKKNQDPNSRYCQALGPELDSKEGLSCLFIVKLDSCSYLLKSLNLTLSLNSETKEQS